ncbi:myosin-binding protein 7-like [Lotus japonicus]|uniref:myosin-binding protein 7-like n=1 Tax=Lotus japonicus TaxID=34305 RepID=UPI002588A51C|nr:myosin-binding protein 7-like [Lotus japonicus]
MVETSMAESDITAMKETLRAQQQLLQKLYAELDQEREASATAASEAMDMILRLQGEKAAVKMESSHYKRMTEEKIGHAEATLEVFEELMYQKEMEIASLEFQVLAYKHKLLTLGADFNASELEFPEDFLLSKNDQRNVENDQGSSVRRLHSLPPIQWKNNSRAHRKRDRSPSPVPVPNEIPKVVESENQEAASPRLDLPKKSVDFAFGTLDSYWDQIQSLDEKMKVISDCKDSGSEKVANLRNRRGRSCSIFAQAGTKVAPTISDKVNHFEAIANPSCSVNVHDVFEVPQTSEKHKVGEQGRGRLVKWMSETDNRLTKPDPVSEEIIESHVKHDMDKLKSILSTQREIKKPGPKELKTIGCENKEGMEVDCNAQAEFQKLHQRIDLLERDRISSRQEIMHEGNGEEQLRLLKDIHNQLKLIQSEMRSWKTRKASLKKDMPLDPLQEAMLYFWM